MNEENITIYDMIENIVSVVFYNYNNYITDPTLKDDLFQQGYLKAYELLNNGNYDPSMSLRNYIFTGVRNEMHNMLYHINKVQMVDLEKLDKYDNIVGYHEMGDYEVEEEFVKEICDKFKRHGDYYPLVINYLIKLGIVQATKIPEQELNPSMRDGIIVHTLWELYKKEANNGWKSLWWTR